MQSSTFQIREESFSTDLYLRVSLVVISIALLSTLIILLFHWQKLPPILPLFYSLPWGEEQLSTPLSLILVALSGLVFTLVNSLIAFFLYSFSKYLPHMLLIASVVTTLLIEFTVVQIIILAT